MKLRLSVGVILSLLLVGSMAIGASAAAGGSLDTTWGGSGTVVTPVLADDEYIDGVAVQKDGKVVTAGYSDNGANDDFAVVRYNKDGTLDTTFGVGGKVTTAIGASTDEAWGVAIQKDGQIVVVGQSYNGANDDFAVVRYNTDGSLDTTFDTDGKATTAVGGDDDWANAVALQSDGKIVAAGGTNNGANDDFAVVRYNTNGSLDTTFDTDGKATTAVGGDDEEANAVALQSDGKIVAAGDSYNGANDDFAVVRYNTNGSLDTTFDTDGKVTTSFGGTDDTANGVGIQADAKIVAGGGVCGACDMGAVRYNANGSLDTTFDTDGKALAVFPAAMSYADAVAIQTDGRIVLGGSICCGIAAVARMNANGSLDTTFDTDGMLTTDISGAGDSWFNAIALQKDGQILGGGAVCTATCDFASARYNYGTYLYRSDAIINKVGNDIYWGGQKVNVKVASGKSKIAKVKVQNDGTSADSFAVHGSNSKGKAANAFAVSYWSGSKNITKKVVKGTYETKSLATGESVTIKMKITALGSSGHKTFKVSATSKGYAGSVDTVKAKAKIT